MKLILPLALLIFLIGCSEMEEDYVPPHIVSIDPPIQEFTKEEMLTLAGDVPPWEGPLWEPLPTRYIHLNRGEFATVTITFSAPPEELNLNMNRWGVFEYQLHDGALEATVYCTSTDSFGFISVWGLTRLFINWKGGGQYITFWCPPEEEE